MSAGFPAALLAVAGFAVAVRAACVWVHFGAGEQNPGPGGQAFVATLVAETLSLSQVMLANSPFFAAVMSTVP